MITAKSQRRRRRRLVIEPLERRFVFAAGDLDLTFANQGVLEVGEWLRVLPDQHTYVDSRSRENGKIDLLVLTHPSNELEWLRFKRDGTRDWSFGTNATDDPSERDSSQLETMFLRKSNGLYARYFSDGTVDHAFEELGLKRHYNNYQVLPDDIMWQTGSENTLKWVRLRSDRSMIEFAIGELGPNVNGRWGHVSDADGNLYVLTTVDANSRLMVARYNNDGMLDTTFADQGILVIDGLWGAPMQQPQIALQPNGDILVYGVGKHPPSVPGVPVDTDSWRNFLVRYHSDGQIDHSFGEDGAINTGFRPIDFSVERAILTDSSGRILVLGTEDRQNVNKRTVKRYHPDGTLDSEFTEAAKHTLQTLNSCRYYGTQMELVDGKDVVLLLHDAPRDSSGPSCVYKSVMIKLLGDDSANSTVPEVPDEPTNSEDPRAAIRVSATDLEGIALSEIAVGQRFKLSVHAADQRATPTGVFAAYVDLLFGGAQIRIHEPLEYGNDFQNGRSGSMAAVMIDEVGAFGGLSRPDATDSLLFSVVISVDAPGQLEIKTEAADDLPDHRFLLYGQSRVSSEPTQVAYGSFTIPVRELPWRNLDHPLDVDNDGFVAPDDALMIIELINRAGSGLNQELRAKDEFAAWLPSVSLRNFYPDVNGDGYIAPDDVLTVIDELHASSAATAASAEGKAIAQYIAANDTPHRRRRLGLPQHWILAADDTNQRFPPQF